jgi:hypothetical protein
VASFSSSKQSIADTIMLTKTQLEELISNYAEFIVDGMDYKTLEQFACDSIAQSFEDYTAAELYDEIVESYDQEVFESLLPESVNFDGQTSLYDEVVKYTQHSNL